MGDTLGFVSLYSHAWEWTISTNRLMTVRASSAHGTVSIRLSFWLAIATRLNWAGRRWVRTLKRTFGISQRCLPLAEPVSVYHVQAKPGAGPIFGTFFGR